MLRLFLAALATAWCSLALAQGINHTTVATAAPTAGVYSTVLAGNDARRGCTITNIGVTAGSCQYAPPGTAVSAANAIPVPANGGQFFCSPAPGGSQTVSDPVQCTCASGTCAFVINSIGQ